MISTELLQAYLEDTIELLNEYDRLLKKRNSIGSLDTQSVDRLFRIMHTVKASSSMLNITRIVDVSHNVENLLSYLRTYGNSCMSHAQVLDILFKNEYFLRSQLRNVKYSMADDGDNAFEKELSNFMKKNMPSGSVISGGKIAIGRLFDVMEKAVSDMCEKLGKKAVFKSSGEELLIDRRLYDELTVPVMHIVRNAVDHGMDTPSERIAEGKPETNCIAITAGREDNVFFISISNDGKGLDIEAILDRAEEHCLLKKPRESYTPQEAAAFILKRGFTTSDSITEYSGRGIGMDVVASSVHELGGTMLINGFGTDGFSVTIAIPEDAEAKSDKNSPKDFHS